MEKHLALRRSKRLATACLMVSVAVFIGTSLAPRNGWSDLLRAMSEAAMVGALADWFAVTALFRRVPLPGLWAHTAIIPRNKDRIAENLGRFVNEKFLSPQALAEMIRRHDPAQLLAAWLAQPDNARQLGGYMARAMAGVLEFTDDRKIQGFVRDAMQAALTQVDLTRSLGSILDTLTQDGRHQQLLDRAIVQLADWLNRPQTREFIAQSMVDWIKREYPKMEKLLPSNWLGEKSAATLAEVIDTLLTGIAQDAQHGLRQAFDREVAKLITRLKEDESLRQRGEQFKRELLQGPAVSSYLSNLWASLREWIRTDLAQPDSQLHAKAAGATAWVGQALLEDAALRASLNAHLQQMIATIGPEMAGFLTRHISDTVRNWDAAELSRQIELQIGPDLQTIRINGTVVGALVGALLFGATLLMQHLAGNF